jgi:hypothetical protein
VEVAEKVDGVDENEAHKHYLGARPRPPAPAHARPRPPAPARARRAARQV